MAAGEANEALKEFEQAREIQERLVSDNPSVTAFQGALATSHYNIGVLQIEKGETAEALKAFERARKINELLVHDNPTATEFQSNLANCHNGIGVSFERAGKADEALKSHELGRVVLERLVRENPSVTEFQHGLAATCVNIGVLLKVTGKPNDALKWYEQACEILERLVSDSPSETKFQSDLASSHHNIGLLLSDVGKPAEATKAHERAHEILERLAEAHSESSDFAGDLGRTLYYLARIERDAGRFVAALDLLRKAIEWQKKALAINPHHPTCRQFLANCYNLLRLTGQDMNDPALVTEAQKRRRELDASDPILGALDQRLAAVLAGEGVKDNLERLKFAQRAYDTQLFATAAHFWGEAFQHDAGLGDDRQTQHAYNAACAAALAGAGHGVDDPKPDDTAKAKLRAQALVWLQAELNIWSKLLETATPEIRQAIAQTLSHWQQDSDLAGVRGDSIEALPEPEREPWKALWQRVQNLLDKSQPASPSP